MKTKKPPYVVREDRHHGILFGYRLINRILGTTEEYYLSGYHAAALNHRDRLNRTAARTWQGSHEQSG